MQERRKKKGGKMKTKISYCICCDHVPDSGDSVYYGMPILRVTSDMSHYSIYCPKCGLGGLNEYASPYKAVLEWNELQERARAITEGLLK